MEDNKQNSHFTCVSYNNVDFLIPSKYIVSGMYLNIPKESKNIVFNRETLPHIFIGEYLETQFNCKPMAQANAVIILNVKDFEKDVGTSMVSVTDTAFPFTGNLALSLTGNISSSEINISKLRLMPLSIRSRMMNCGICAIQFKEDGRKQILISPDSILRRYFSGGAE